MSDRPAPTAERPTLDVPASRGAPAEPAPPPAAPPPPPAAPAPPPVAPNAPDTSTPTVSAERDARGDREVTSERADERSPDGDTRSSDTMTLDDAEVETAVERVEADDGTNVITDVPTDLVAEPIDASADAGVDVVPDSSVPDVGVPDAAQPEAPDDPRLDDHDPAANIDDIVEQRLDDTPRDVGPDSTLGGGPSAPTEGPGPDFDADDPFHVDLDRTPPELGELDDDPFSLDVSAPPVGSPKASDQVIPDGTGGFTFIGDAGGSSDFVVTKHDDGYEIFMYDDDPDAPLFDEDDRLTATEIERLTGINPEEVAGPEPEGDGGGVQTEMDRLEMRLHQAVDWIFGSGDDDSDAAGDYDPDSGNVAPGEFDPSDPNFQHQISERDGAITWGDHDSGLDGSKTPEYDGVDYGQFVDEVDIPVAEAADAILGDPFGQPDVDPVEHDDGADAMMIE